jgi:hypothetical protein
MGELPEQEVVGILDFQEIFSVFLPPIITAGEFLRNPPGPFFNIKVDALNALTGMR